MNMSMSLSSPDLSDEDIQNLAYELCATLVSEVDATAKIAEQQGSPGAKGDPVAVGTGARHRRRLRRTKAKGDPVAVGTIILSLIGSGGVAVTLINVLKSYVDRGTHLKVNIKNKKGETVEISSDNLGPAQIEQTTQLVKSVLESS